MSKSTQHFLNETKNLFSTLHRLQSAGISVIDVSLTNHEIKIERPTSEQMMQLRYGVAHRDDLRNELFISMNGFKITWKQSAPIREIKPKRKVWGFV